MRAFMKGSKNVMTAHVEQLIVTLGSEDQEVRRSALACLRCVLSHIQSLDQKLALKRQRTAAKRPKQAKNGVSISEKVIGKKEENEKTKKKVRAKIEIRAREIAQIVCEALVSLQILLEEVSLLSAIVRVIKEVRVLCRMCRVCCVCAAKCMEKANVGCVAYRPTAKLRSRSKRMDCS